MKYVREPLSLPKEYTEPVVIQEFSGIAEELPSYTGYLLGVVAEMNEDRATTGSIIRAYEAQH